MARGWSDARILKELAALPSHKQRSVVGKLSWPQQRELLARWAMWAHAGQLSPEGDPHVWLIMAGRGFGKTRAGAEWISEQARQRPGARLALVGASMEDARRVMVEGPSGLLAVARHGEVLTWRRERGELVFPSGAVAQIYSASAPEVLRGAEHHAAWCDEIGKWPDKRAKAAWDNLMLGLRGGTKPRVLATTTPRTTELMQKVKAMAEKGDALMQGRTVDNPHLPASFIEAMTEEYAGTRLGRQELDGELLLDVEGALWSRTMLDGCRVAEAEKLVRAVVAVDPPASAGGDACGIVAVGLGRDGLGYVLEDASVAGLSPEGWARAVAMCVARHGAERVVAEKNQGGEMVASVLLAADERLPLRLVSATRGKSARAEPVAALYERGKVRHVGAFAALEDELCGLVTGGGYEGPGASPDRADALVWALTELMLRRPAVARVRGL